MHNDDFEWCCPLFRSAVERRGGAGLSIAIFHVDKRVISDGLGFFLESRGVSDCEESEFANAQRAKVMIQASQGITYCPWCGQSLRDYYRNQRDSLPIHGTVEDGL